MYIRQQTFDLTLAVLVRLALFLCRLQDLDRKTACLLLQVGVIFFSTFLLETENSTKTVYIDRPMGVL